MSDAIDAFGQNEHREPPSPEFRAKARIRDKATYDRLYRESLDEPDAFWRRECESLSFRKTWSSLLEWKLPHARWFLGAELNLTESCLDQHLKTRGQKRAIVFEGEPGDLRELTYAELHAEVETFSAALRSRGVGKGDRVAIYMGMVPEALIAMLACARIGATHTVVFGGFAADALRERIIDSGAKAVLTQDGAYRRGKVIALKATVDEAVREVQAVSTVVVYRRIGQEACPIEMQKGRDVDWASLVDGQDRSQGYAEVVDAEHPLFILYTSGSTGKPKGVLHTTAGYLAGAHVTTKYVFDLQEDDIYWCTADIGWITGHSYVAYGPLSNGATLFMYEGAPNAPDWGRFWQLVERHKVTILYTAPTAIRAFMRAGDSFPESYNLSSLRLLGSVGEPINPEAWRWYHRVIGGGKCPIVDTWWQTETGAILMTTLPGVHDGKPGACGLPLFGVEPAIIGVDGSELPPGSGGRLALKRPWPSIMRTVWGDDERFFQQYFAEIPGAYFSGDAAFKDTDGYHTVVGRLDDVLKLSGHRVGTAEVESCLVGHSGVAEAAAVGRPHPINGQALVTFVATKPGILQSEELERELMEHVAHEIGRFARPERVCLVAALPKTRSGKIMRRLLKSIASGEDIQGDLSTLEDRDVVEAIQKAYQTQTADQAGPA
jgi:acetyl-CoA synthetase